MDFTKLPTDNFYIFLSLAGLILIIFFANLFVKKRIELANITNAIEDKVDKLESEANYIELNVANIVQKISFHTDHFKIKYGVEYKRHSDIKQKAEAIPSKIIQEGKIESYIKDYVAIENLRATHFKDAVQLKLAITLSKREVRILKKTSTEFRYISIFSATVIMCGIIMCVFGFKSWYLKNQFYQDRLLKVQYETTLKNAHDDTLLKSQSIINIRDSAFKK